MESDEKNKLFQTITDHLMEDSAPSEFMNRVSNIPQFHEYPFQLLELLKKTEQSRKYHPEGNVWNHTMMVIDEAARVRNDSVNPMAFMWAAVLHDIGKPGTTRMRRGKITSYDHDQTGAMLCIEFFNALDVDPDFMERVRVLVKYHMHMLYILNDLPYGDKDNLIREAGIHDLALFSLCDRLGRKGADRQKEMKEYELYLEKLKRLEQKCSGIMLK